MFFFNYQSQLNDPLRPDNIRNLYHRDIFPISVDTSQQSMSLFVFLRHVARLPGTKVMCGEGGCGACVVTATYQLPGTKGEVTKAVNAVNVMRCLLRIKMGSMSLNESDLLQTDHHVNTQINI